MATVTRTTTFVDGNTLTAAQLNNEFNNLLNALALTNSDISGSAAIALSKLASSTQGSILYDNGSSIVELAPGSSGQVLQTQGAGANPQWASNTSTGKLQSVQQSTTLINSSTSSASNVDLVSVTFTPTATANIIIRVAGSWYNTAAGNGNNGDIVFDGSNQTPGNAFATNVSGSALPIPFSGQYYIANVSAASHTAKFQFRAGAGTVTVYGAVLIVEVYNA